MEWSVLFLGPVGSGKTQAIRSVSDIDVVDTEALATDETAAVKQTTTVAMDVGVMMLGGLARPTPTPPPDGELRRVNLRYRCPTWLLVVAPDGARPTW